MQVNKPNEFKSAIEIVVFPPKKSNKSCSGLLILHQQDFLPIVISSMATFVFVLKSNHYRSIVKRFAFQAVYLFKFSRTKIRA